MHDPAAAVAENRLLGQPAPTTPNQVWVGDITYLPLFGGRWCYLARRLFPARSRLALAAQMLTELMPHAMEQALTLRQAALGYRSLYQFEQDLKINLP